MEKVESIAISFESLRQGGAWIYAKFYEYLSKVLADRLFLTSQKAKKFEDLNIERQADLEDAQEVQSGALSRIAKIPNFSLSIKCQFADILGGDFYSVRQIDEERYAIVIGDVTGHGTPAALFSVMILSFFQNLSKESDSPQMVVEKVNEMCCTTMPSNRFATTFYGIYHVTEQNLYYVSGGHHAALVLHDGKVSTLPITPGLPLGIFDSTISSYDEDSLSISKRERPLIAFH